MWAKGQKLKGVLWGGSVRELACGNGRIRRFGLKFGKTMNNIDIDLCVEEGKLWSTVGTRLINGMEARMTNCCLRTYLKSTAVYNTKTTSKRSSSAMKHQIENNTGLPKI